MIHHRTPTAIVAGAATLVMSAAIGCSSNPTSPDPVAGRMDLLPPGAYSLLVSFYGPDQVGACRADPPRPTGALGLFAVAAVTISQDSDTWVARNANPADGDLEVRIRPVRDEAALNGRVVVATVDGTIRGSAPLPGGGLTLSDRLSFGATTVTRIEGTVSASASGLGTISGEITLSSGVGAVSCPAARWTLLRGSLTGF